MTYRSTILADNPLHYWPLDELSGFFARDIGSSPMHLISAPTLNMLGYSGVATGEGGALTHNNNYFGTQNQVSITVPFTAEVWMFPIGQHNPSGAGPTNGIAFGWDGVSANNGAIQFLASDTIQCQIAGVGATAVGPILRYAWHLVNMSYDGATIRLYVDGSLAASAAAAHAGYNQNQNVCIGASVSNTFGFVGGLADPAMYPAALSAAQCLAHYNAADLRTQIPHPNSVVNTTGVETDLSDVLKAVRVTFPST